MTIKTEVSSGVRNPESVVSVHVVGGGLAGTEAAWQIARAGIPVTLHEMRPVKMLGSLPEGIAIALGMMLIARPLSVLAFQRLSPFSLRESLLVSWCGLRGAVPLALSFTVVDAIPHVRGIDAALVPKLVDNAEVIVFCVVVLNLLIQGLSLGPLARWLKLGETDEPAAVASPG